MQAHTHIKINRLFLRTYVYINIHMQLQLKKQRSLRRAESGIWKVLEEENGKEKCCNYTITSTIK